MQAYRSGELDSPRGLFFADSYDAAWLYANHSGLPVVAYEIQISAVLEVENQYVWLAKKTGKSVEQIKAEKSRANDPYWLRNLDRHIMEEESANGYDAVRYTRPTTPNAAWELVVFSSASCHRLGECDNNGHIRSPSSRMGM